jgi:hypothetical protein
MSHVGLVGLQPEERATHYLLPECLVFRDGASAPIELGAKRGKLLVITLEIHRVTEYDGLLVSVWGSADKSDWGTTPLLTFPTKSYCGVYSALLNLANNPSLEYLSVHWHLRHWAKSESTPAFGFSVIAQESGSRIANPRPGYPRLAVVRGA